MGVMRVGAMSIEVIAGKCSFLADMEEVLRRLDLLLMERAHFGHWGLHGDVFHRDSRGRLNGKAQCHQQDDEESAAKRHRGKV